MTSIGIIGGVGYKATSYFYNRINQLFELKMGKGNSCPIVLKSLNFIEINSLLPENNIDVALLLKPSVQFLEQQDIACAVLVNNTMHKALDIILSENKFEKIYCHVGNLINEKLDKISEKQNVVILGTAFTMTDNYLKSFVPKQHFIIEPSKKTIEKVDDLRKLYFDSSDKLKAEECFNYLKENYSTDTTFIIACTELSIAFADFNKGKNWIDTIDLQCEKALNLLINS